MSKEVAKVAAAGLPAVDDFSEFAGHGLENVTQRDILIPRLTVLQALSPQCNPRESKFIKGAKIGDICDVGLEEIFEQPLIVLPVYYCKQWMEWAPRASGKGLVNIHSVPDVMDRCSPNAKGQPTTPEGNTIQETMQFFCLNLSAGGRRSFIPMASTQLKKGKRWLSLATSEKLTHGATGQSYTPPLFYRSYALTTVQESNNEGSWCGWKVDRHVALPEIEGYKSLLDEAKQFRSVLADGSVKADVASMAEEVQGSHVHHHGDEVPF